jgi:hypothetical protein
MATNVWSVGAVLAMAAILAAGCGQPGTMPGGLMSGQDVRNFDSDKPGRLPDGWKAAGGEWKVMPDATAPSKLNVLSQMASSPSAEYNVAILEAGTSMQDVNVSVKLRAVGGRIDQGGGIVWRARDARDYYVARWNPLESNYRFYKVVDGVRTQLATAENVKAGPGWHTLAVKMTGDAVACFFDGKEVLKATDGTFKDAGKIGLWTKADAVTNFDDLLIAPSK